jgi:hypothetical protein
MAFCGQCGLLLNTNITKCPRCGTVTEFDAAMPGTPAENNAATIIAHTNNSQPGSHMPYTPPPASDVSKAGYYTASGGNAPHSGSNYMIPGAPPYQSQTPGMYQQGVFPGTDPGQPFQPLTPPRKTRKWPFVLVLVLIVALVAVTVMFFAVGSNPFARLFTPTAQVTPIAQPAPTTVPVTPQVTTTPLPTQRAQAVVQQYYNDINAHKYQDAYYLWVSNPDNYDHYVQGFAHTHRDDMTFGDAISQTDGTIQVNVTILATEDAAGGGTQTSTYTGYYTIGQQTDGSWKIINGQLG